MMSSYWNKISVLADLATPGFTMVTYQLTKTIQNYVLSTHFLRFLWLFHNKSHPVFSPVERFLCEATVAGSSVCISSKLIQVVK